MGGTAANGRERWQRRLAVASAGSLAVLVATTDLFPSSYDDVIPDGESPLRLPDWLYLPPFAVATVVFVVSLVAIWAHTAVRLARAAGAERAQLAWLAAAVVPVFGGTFFLGRAQLALLSCLLPVAIAVGVFRHNLFGIQVVLRRTLVYAVLTAAVSGTYLAVTAAGGTGLGGGGLPGVLAAALVAVGLTPARNRLQHLVDRFVYGDRRDPMQAVARLGDSVAATDEPELLRAVVEGVLRPGALDEAGLVEALRRHAGTLAARLPVRVEITGELPRLPTDVENAAYLIAVEALTNVVRHADAGAATVRLTVDSGAEALILAVQDNGRGITGAPRPVGVGSRA
ncbi:ATP-binding protein [Frankia sp. CiP1_Cm_nod2]|uniref:ATP-binding protein n=1 Tax=Frankia sp. CiP1_Cm_nod2 TaxID=2897161 RepID=UPI0020254EAF